MSEAAPDPVMAAQAALRSPAMPVADKLAACEAAFPLLRTDNGEFIRSFAMLLHQANGKHTDQSVSLLEQAIALCPSDAGMWAELGAAYAQYARFDDSLRCLDEALRINPNQSTARWNRALEMLARGDWQTGWQEYRFGQVVGLRPQRSPLPEWDGSNLDGGTLYLWCEQGIGDQIMMLRFVKDVREKAGPQAKIIVEIRPELLPLFANVDGADQVVVIHPSMALQTTDKDPQHASLMSLPRIMGILPTTLQKFPYPAGFTTREVLPSGKNVRVGLVWKGSSGHVNNAARSADIDIAREIIDRSGEGFEFVSLQYGAEPVDGVTMEYPPLTTFMETAQVIKTLDMVVGVDTGVCHLAGAMACPTLLMLAKAADFRWMRDTEKTPWYPNHRLFRQTMAGDWAPVIEQVVTTLHNPQNAQAIK